MWHKKGTSKKRASKMENLLCMKEVKIHISSGMKRTKRLNEQ